MSAQWLPKGFHTITPNIVADDAEGAVAFLKKAFGAVENYRLTMSDGKVTHLTHLLPSEGARYFRERSPTIQSGFDSCVLVKTTTESLSLG
jgi:hypothetical protein